MICTRFLEPHDTPRISGCLSLGPHKAAFSLVLPVDRTVPQGSVLHTPRCHLVHAHRESVISSPVGISPHGPR